jgi:hypothetical protein
MRRSLFGLLLGVLPAVALSLPWQPLELGPGIRFGSVGMSWQYLTSGGGGSSESSLRSHFEPVLEAGLVVPSGLAVGGWLTTLDAFPEQGSIFTHTPVPSFGASAGYLLPIGRWGGVGANFRVGLTALGYTFFARRYGALVEFRAGAFGPVGVGLEVGEVWDVIVLPVMGIRQRLSDWRFTVALKVQGYGR